MVKSLTMRGIEAIRPGATRREIPDGGLTGLYLVVQTSGAMSWAVRYRANGRPRKHTLGTYPAFGLLEARRAAATALRSVAEGKDPAAEKRTTKLSHGEPDPDLFDVVLADFVHRHVRKKPRSAPENERLLSRNVVPRWTGRGIQSIRKRDVIELLDSVVDRGSPVAANRVLAIIRKFFNWCVERGVLDISPAMGVKAPTPEQSRDRVLSDDELRLIWRAAAEIGYPFGPIVHLLILTGQRRSEVSEATWVELRLGGDAPAWVIPKERAKNSIEHTVPLPPEAVAVLEGLVLINSRAGYIFSTTGNSPVSGHSNAKEGLDRSIRSLVGNEGEVPPPWTIHDLRRTAASGMARLGIEPHIIEAVLNHKSGTIRGVAAIYNRHRYEAEKRTALSAWGRYVKALVAGRSTLSAVNGGH